MNIDVIGGIVQHGWIAAAEPAMLELKCKLRRRLAQLVDRRAVRSFPEPCTLAGIAAEVSRPDRSGLLSRGTIEPMTKSGGSSW